MSNIQAVLAKSVSYGNISLLDHTKQVVEAIKVFAKEFNLNESIAIKGGILHDLGKAHPYFQRKIKNYNENSLFEKQQNDYTHRHEISSLAFLPVFPKEEWAPIIDMVIGHHKPIINDKASKGILDIAENERSMVENHLIDFENWSKVGIEIIEFFGIKVKKISKEEAADTIEYVINYCEKKGPGWSKWRGLLMAADHFASAFMFDTTIKLKPLFKVPKINYYFDEKRISDLYPLSNLKTKISDKHTIVVAPTGAGKTDFLMKRCNGRIFYTLPFQASINAMWERLKNDLNKENPLLDIRLQHATSKIVVRNNKAEQVLQQLIGSSVKVMTPHQLAAIIFGTPGYESTMLDLKGSDIILDEIHTYSDYSRAMVLEIIKTLLRLNCRIHIGTATMPDVLYKEIVKILSENDSVYEVKLFDTELEKFNRHKIYKHASFEEIQPILTTALENKEKVLVVFNTVKKAQEIFKQIEAQYPSVSKMLIHSRFRRKDRIDLERKLKTEFNGDGSEEYKDGLSPCILVSTQVVEVSLDISFDRMITECAPIDSLIQRFGRVNRKRNYKTIGKYKPIHVIKPEGNVLPYKLEVLEKSFNQLPDNGEVLEEKTIQNKINTVYPNIATKEIDIHIINIDGNFRLKELTNNRKAVLLEALEIESAVCILEKDKDRYLTASWEERIQLEIPINFKTIIRYKNMFEQLEVGSYPFVVQYDFDQYKKYGLELTKPDNFL